MAGVLCVAQTAEIAAAVAAAKTLLQVVAAANHPIKITRWGVFFDGTSATAEPVQVRLLRQSTAGTMSALTPVELTNHGVTVQTSAQHTATAEPTSGNVLDIAEVHPQTGYEVNLLGQEIIVPGGGRIGLEITAPAAVNARAKIHFEE